MELERHVGWLLGERGWTLAVAESCTGGLLGHRLTAVGGCSRYFAGGIIAYSNAVKVRLLDVDAAVLAAVGAVSAEVAGQMAAGVMRRLEADVGVGITGIAGPEGGTAAKPIGLVYVALAAADGGCVRRHQFSGGRETIKTAATEAALELLREFLVQ